MPPPPPPSHLPSQASARTEPTQTTPSNHQKSAAPPSPSLPEHRSHEAPNTRTAGDAAESPADGR
eukprot:5910859-Pleurochrysis_carterae.AAC.1